MLLHVDICDPIRQNEFQVAVWQMIMRKIFYLFSFFNTIVVFSKSAQIAFLNFKSHSLEKNTTFST